MAIERPSAVSRLPKSPVASVNRPAPQPLTATPPSEPVNSQLQESYQGDLISQGAASDETIENNEKSPAPTPEPKSRRGRPAGSTRSASRINAAVTGDGANPRFRLKEITDEASALRTQCQSEIAGVKARYQPRLDELKAEYNALNSLAVSSTFSL